MKKQAVLIQFVFHEHTELYMLRLMQNSVRMFIIMGELEKVIHKFTTCPPEVCTQHLPNTQKLLYSLQKIQHNIKQS